MASAAVVMTDSPRTFTCRWTAIATVWDRLAKGEDFDSLRPIVAYLGVGPEKNSDEPRVGRVYEGSGAQQAGMQVGDVLLKFDGTELSRYSRAATVD